jgi:hypothetical protein
MEQDPLLLTPTPEKSNVGQFESAKSHIKHKLKKRLKPWITVGMTPQPKKIVKLVKSP